MFFGLQDCEENPESAPFGDEIKRAKVGLINLKAYLGQVDVIEFANTIKNEATFKVGELQDAKAAGGEAQKQGMKAASSQNISHLFLKMQEIVNYFIYLF